MGRRVDQHIEVRTSHTGMPQSFVWEGRLYAGLRLLERWKESGCWWDGEPGRLVFRMKDASGRIFELHRLQKAMFDLEDAQSPPDAPSANDSWILYGVED